MRCARSRVRVDSTDLFASSPVCIFAFLLACFLLACACLLFPRSLDKFARVPGTAAVSRARARAMLRRRAAGAVVALAPAVAVLTPRSAESSAEPRVVGVIVCFRHGAREPVFKLPDSGKEEYVTMTSAPLHATPAELVGGKHYNAVVPRSGLLTQIGWSQGEALGRMLQKEYGVPAEVIVRSTDVSRTVLTARAVLTGLFEDAPAPAHPVRIDIESTSPLPFDTHCSALAAVMAAGRAAHRASDGGYSAVRSAVSRAYGLTANGENANPPVLAVHDDCVARRFYGHPPSKSVHVSLCDWSSRESAREVRHALRSGGVLATRLSAGKLCATLARHLRELQAAPRDALAGPRMVLLSGHDTTLMMLLNVLDADGARVPLGEWPPHTSHITLELRDDETVRVLYCGGAAQIVERARVSSLLERLDELAVGDEEYRQLCDQIPNGRGRLAFFWGD